MTSLSWSKEEDSPCAPDVWARDGGGESHTAPGRPQFPARLFTAPLSCSVNNTHLQAHDPGSPAPALWRTPALWSLSRTQQRMNRGREGKRKKGKESVMVLRSTWAKIHHRQLCPSTSFAFWWPHFCTVMRQTHCPSPRRKGRKAGAVTQQL